MSLVNLSCVRGDTTEWDLAVVKDTVPIDLTGGKIWMTALRARGGSQIFQRTTESGHGITIDPDQDANPGVAVIKLAIESTSGLASELTTLYYDIQVKTAAGDVWTVNYGDLVVTPDATTEIV